MPTHALLGATGSTGGAVLQYLLDEPIANLELRVCVRNKSKLLKSYPDLEATRSFKCTIIEANLDDTSAVEQALSKAEIIYNCIASNDSAPGTSVAQDAANSIIKALQALQQTQGPAYVKPTLLINRSTTLNETLPGGVMKSLVHFVLGCVYDDIAKAVDLFRAAARDDDLVCLICMDAPALHAGTKRTGHSLSLTEEPFRSLNYPDLGAAFVDVAKSKEQYQGKAVIVGATGPVEEHWDVLRGYIFRGLKARVLGI